MSAPTHLPDDIALVWTELSGRARQLGPSFEAFCGQVARLREAQRRIATEGMVIADAAGRPIPHPALDIERHALREVARGERLYLEQP